MNSSDYGQRPRAPPAPLNGVNGVHIPSGARYVQDQRNGNAPPVQTGAEAGAQTNRAERFEDEKKRIIESCFSKKEADGSSMIPCR